MRAETVIATHGNTDFDAFAVDAGRALPLSRLGRLRSRARSTATCASSTACTRTSSSSREAGPARARRDPAPGRRRDRSREPARRARAGRARPGRREGRLRPPRRRGPRLGAAENAVALGGRALTTTLVGILAEREIAVTPLEATVFALGIHEDTGSLTYPSATRRDAEALAWCLRHGARQELLAHVPAHAARPRRSASSWPRCSRRWRRPRGRGRRGARRRRLAGPATSTGSRTSRTRSST